VTALTKEKLLSFLPSFSDVLFFIGAALLFYGTYLLSPAIAFILLGCIFMAPGVAGVVRTVKPVVPE